MSFFTNALFIVVLAMGILYSAFKLYGRFLSRRVMGFDDRRPTPAVEQQDGLDFVPTRPAVLFGHHFASIAGLAPIVGPAIAVYWGWLPALIWVLIGCTLMGAVHDLAALFTSIRHKARSIGGLTEEIIGPRARILFLLIIFFLLALAMGVFAIIMAKLFVNLSPEAVVPTFSLIVIAMVIGTMVYKGGFRLGPITVVGVILMFIMMFVGMKNPVQMHKAFVKDDGTKQAIATAEQDPTLHRVPAQIEYFAAQTETEAVAEDLTGAQSQARSTWVYILLVYALVASVLPVWLLLQPRDYINCFQLYAGLLLLFLGFVVLHPRIEVPAIRDTSALGSGNTPALLPLLFITVACGAVSGFHNLVSSGTTARQLRKESDAHIIGYGGMLTEGLLAVFVIVACVAGMSLVEFNSTYAGFPTGSTGLAGFLEGGSRIVASPFHYMLGSRVGLEPLQMFFKNFMAVMVVSFAMTTLDSATRLLRYNIEELGKTFKMNALQNRYVASIIAVVAIGYFALMEINGQPAGLTLWQLFGTTNQMLACLGLLVASVFLYKLGKPIIYTMLPMVAMLVIVAWAITIKLGDFYSGWMKNGDAGNLSLLIIGSLLAVMAAWMIVEAVFAFLRARAKFQTAAVPVELTAASSSPGGDGELVGTSEATESVATHRSTRDEGETKV